MPATPRIRTRGRPDRLVVVMSDIELGAGGAIDDFPSSPWLAERLLRYLEPPFDGLHLDLVFNGDTFDLLKTSVRGGWPTFVTSEIAVAKMSRIADAHPRFFEGLREILARRGSSANVHFVAGNHDLELLFPEVQSIVSHLVARDERVRFHGHGFDLGRLQIEHGSQRDPLFRVDPETPFIEHGGKTILNLSWASVALLEVAIPLQPILYHLDRLKPRRLVLDLLPEVNELLTSLAWRYWTRDWWRDVFGGRDPLKRVSWTLLREVVWRLAAREVDLSIDDAIERELEARDDLDAWVIGHLHEPRLSSFGNRRALRTGAIRDEFMISRDGCVQTPVNKSWAEIWMAGDEVVSSALVDEPSPPRPAGTMPISIFECLPAVRARLAEVQLPAGEASARREEEAREGAPK